MYPFLDYDVLEIFDEMMNAGMIELPETKRPEEARRTTILIVANIIVLLVILLKSISFSRIKLWNWLEKDDFFLRKIK